MENFKQKPIKELKKMSASEYDAYLKEMQSFIKERRKENSKALQEEKIKKENARNKEVYLSLKKIFEKAEIKATQKEMIDTIELYFTKDNNRDFLAKAYQEVAHGRRLKKSTPGIPQGDTPTKTT